MFGEATQCSPPFGGHASTQRSQSKATSQRHARSRDCPRVRSGATVVGKNVGGGVVQAATR
eukprot:gene18552-biopygen11467